MEKKTLHFTAVRNMLERKDDDFYRSSLYDNKVGELAIIELTADGAIIGEMRIGANIRPCVESCKEILRDYAEEIFNRFKGLLNNYPMVTVKIVDNADKRCDKQNVLCKREYWVEFK